MVITFKVSTWNVHVGFEIALHAGEAMWDKVLRQGNVLEGKPEERWATEIFFNQTKTLLTQPVPDKYTQSVLR